MVGDKEVCVHVGEWRKEGSDKARQRSVGPKMARQRKKKCGTTKDGSMDEKMEAEV